MPSKRRLFVLSFDGVKRFFEIVSRGIAEEDETNLVGLPSSRQRALHAVAHDARALIHRKAGDAGADRGHRNRAHAMLVCESERIVHRRAQRIDCGAATQLHARRMDDGVRGQLSPTCDRGLANLDRSRSIALALDRRTAALANRAGHSAAKQQVVVGRVDDGINMLLHKISRNDQDARRRHSSTSATLSSNSSRVALAMPLTPIDEMVIDAHATPHTRASCSPPGCPPVLNHRASMPPASASPAPVVSTTGLSVNAGTCITPYSVYAARPSAPCLRTSPNSHHWRRNSSGSLPPSAANSSWLQKNQPARRRTSLDSGGRAWTYDSMASAASSSTGCSIPVSCAWRSGRIDPTKAQPLK